MRLLFNELKTFRGQLWLNDIDKEALDRSASVIGSVLPQVKSAQGNVIELLRDAKSLPRFDLIVAGGLFDLSGRPRRTIRNQGLLLVPAATRAFLLHQY